MLLAPGRNERKRAMCPYRGGCSAVSGYDTAHMPAASRVCDVSSLTCSEKAIIGTKVGEGRQNADGKMWLARCSNFKYQVPRRPQVLWQCDIRHNCTRTAYLPPTQTNSTLYASCRVSGKRERALLAMKLAR